MVEPAILSEVLHEVLDIAVLVGASKEAQEWRDAWELLKGIKQTVHLTTVPIPEIPVDQYLNIIRTTDYAQARPMFFPILSTMRPLRLSIEGIRTGLQYNPAVLRAFNLLSSCLCVVASFVEFLRLQAPGYPHKDLVYTLPNSPWSQISEVSELPWGIGRSVLLPGATDATIIGLSRFIPSISSEFAKRLNHLASTLRRSYQWQNLDKAVKEIDQYRNVAHKIHRARLQFEKEYLSFIKEQMSTAVLHKRAVKHAIEVYAQREDIRIDAYVNGFKQYEQLIEAMYWLLSQITFYQRISCITSLIPQQLQQVSLTYGEDTFLSGISPSPAETQQIGQLVHITLPEYSNLLDGIYQLDSLCLTHQVMAGARLLFQARRLWSVEWENIMDCQPRVRDIFKPSVLRDPVDGLEVHVIKPDGTMAAVLGVKAELLGFEVTQTMHIPV